MKRLLLIGLAVAACLAPGALAAPAFEASIERLGPDLRERMRGSSWRPGCPVPLRNLRLLRVTHWGYGGQVRKGKLVLNRAQAPRIRTVMQKLFEAEFPIRRMRLIDAYGADDRRSMSDNNTSAFNCRFVSGTTRWSEHAYGRAIDINPIQNPYVSNGVASPPEGQPYVDRSKRRKGMIRGGGLVVRAFVAEGWGWGGYWTSPKDYQHFSRTGR